MSTCASCDDNDRTQYLACINYILKNPTIASDMCLTAGQLAVYNYVLKNRAATVVDIEKAFMVEPSIANSRLKKLFEKGYINRSRFSRFSSIDYIYEPKV
jgi:DNA-binding MarR family transcriptional regulator